MSSWLERRWYSAAPAPLCLRPLSRLFGAVAARRRRAQQGRAHAHRLALPLVVVGNLAVGGAGKTPFTIWLVEQLRAWGWRPGVISRGYGGRAPHYPLLVTPESDAAICGDEPLLIVRRTGVPLIVDPNRLRAAQQLEGRADVDIIVADDGLQHYRLPRDLEICVVDGRRGLGNGWLLPAGPLREPVARLNDVDLIVVNGDGWNAPGTRPCLTMQLRLADAWPLAGGVPMPLFRWRGKQVHAVAGIGHPQRFFDALSAEGLEVIAHPFPDHHRFSATDLDFADDLPVLMTEKDAMKCQGMAAASGWAVPAAAVLTPGDQERVRQLVDTLKTSH